VDKTRAKKVRSRKKT